tara:strand:+ start:6252 stop:6965 length:714 start_codon:yes stop_codon:yes gene_type:complete
MIQIIQSKELKQILSIDEIKLFKKLQKIISEINKITNLTRLIDGDEYWISQVYDSIWPFLKNSEKIFDGKKFIDIGSGCGFPGLAYSITHPNSEVYLVDSSRKKTEALKRIIEELNIQNKIFVINDRIENIAHQSIYRNNFDIGTTRAVSSPSTVLEYTLPILNRSGLGLLYCGKWTKYDEIKIQYSLKTLKGSIQEINKTFLPNGKGERNIIFIKPIEKCPKSFPRAVGKPAKHPL